MVFGHKTPITAVGRVVSVVALHPIVVEFEGVRCRRLVVNVNLSLLYFELVALVNLDATLVNRQVIQCQRNALALCRNPYRAVVVARPYFPAKVGVARIVRARIYILVGYGAYCLHYATLFQCSHGTFGKRHIAIVLQGSLIQHQSLLYIKAVQAAEALHIFVADAQFLAEVVVLFAQQVGSRYVVELHHIGILHVFGLFVWLSVQIYNLILYLQGLSWQANATLYIVFATVGGARIYLAVRHYVVGYVVSAERIRLVVERALL